MKKADEKVMVSIRRREPLCEPFIKLSLILKTGGVKGDGYLGMCGDRLAQAELIDGEDVRTDFMNFPDIELTAAGVRKCRMILECYVPRGIIEDAHDALVEEKDVRVYINTISRTLRKMTLCELIRTLAKADTRIRRFVAAEIYQRFIFVECFRKIRSAYYKILVRIKYHGLLSAVGRISANSAG